MNVYNFLFCLRQNFFFSFYFSLSFYLFLFLKLFKFDSIQSILLKHLFYLMNCVWIARDDHTISTLGLDYFAFFWHSNWGRFVARICEIERFSDRISQHITQWLDSYTSLTVNLKINKFIENIWPINSIFCNRI